MSGPRSDPGDLPHPEHPNSFRLWSRPSRAGIYDEGVFRMRRDLADPPGSLPTNLTWQRHEPGFLFNGLGKRWRPEAVEQNTRDRKPRPEPSSCTEQIRERSRNRCSKSALGLCFPYRSRCLVTASSPYHLAPRVRSGYCYDRGPRTEARWGSHRQR